MGIIQRLKDARRGAANKIAVQTEYNYRVSPINSNYENLFAQIRPLVDEMKQVRPYGVGRNGARLNVSRTPELAILDYPNAQMGWADFADLMFTTWLTEEELAIRVHKDSRGKIFGYTIIPAGHKEERIAGCTVYRYEDADGTTIQVSRDEVMVLRFSRSPRDPGHGVSPAMSVQIQAQVDDLMWQYERAFFENGARPETIMVIKAATKESFEKKKEELERGFKGADKKNKTLFLWRQFLPDGSEADEVEVKTIQGSNSTLAIREISSIIQDALNKSIGVSNFLLGDDSSAKYDNAELSDHVFTKRRVFPALMMFWSEFQHELDRVTGGLGYGIMFDLELPELTDRLKTKADTNAVNANTLISLIAAGASPSASVTALGLGKKWQGVADSIYSERVTNTKIAQLTASVDKLERFVGAKIATKQAKTIDVKFKGSNYEPVWDLPADEDTKKIYDILIRCAEAEAEENKEFDLNQAKLDINRMLASAASEGALDGAKVLETLAIGKDANEGLKRLINGGYQPTDEALKLIEERSDELLSRFNDDAKKAFKEVRAKAAKEGLTASELKKALKDAMPLFRAETIARTETHAAMNTGRLDLDKQMAEAYGLEIILTWEAHIDERTCDVCLAMDGTEVALGEAFPDHSFLERDGEKIQVDFEHSVWNAHGQTPNAHPRCRCTFNEKVVRR